MRMTAMIVLGVLAWILSAILGALLVAKMIRLRDHRRPDGVEPVAPARAQGTSPQGE